MRPIHAILLLACAALTACANSGPQMIGKETYLASVRVPFSGPAGAKAEALTTANAHCAQQGKQIQLTSITSTGCALRGGCGEAQITFLCLREDDPRFQATKMTKDADGEVNVQEK